MGQEIVYCHECQSRLVGSEFDKGKAFRIQNQNYCLPCAQKLLNSLPPHERDAFAALMTAKESKKSTQRIPVVADPRPRAGDSARHVPFRPDSTNARMASLPPRKAGPSPLLWFGLGGGALAAVALVVAVASGGGGSPTGPSAAGPSTPSSREPHAPSADVRIAEARKLLEAAKTYAALNPSDTVGQIDRFSKAAWHAPGSPVSEAAQAEIDALRRRSRERQQRDLAEIDQQVMALTTKKDFPAAERLLEAAKGRHVDTDWSLGIKRRLGDLAALRGDKRPDPAPPPPPDPPPPSAPPLVIYDDGLRNGWLDHTWGSEIDFAFTGQKCEGSSSIRWTPKINTAGLYLGPAHAQPLAGFTGITFALYGLEPQLPVQICLWTDTSKDTRIGLGDLGPPPPGQWKTYSISFKDVNLRGNHLTGFVIQAFRQQESKAPLLCVDAVSLLRAAPDARPAPAPGSWTPLEPIEIRSAQGVPLRAEADGVVVASGPNPETDTYVLKLKSPLKGLQAIRLDALAHPTLPGGGPGRSDGNGNFVLTEMRVEAGGKPVALQDVVADFSQEHWAVEGAFDGHSRTGWAIHPACGQHHHLVVRLKEPLDAAELTVTLEQESPHHRHVLGRFRLSATAVRPPDPPPGTPALPSPGVLAWRRTWYAAARHAAARDYPAALRALEAEVKNGGAEAAADLADVRLAARLHEEALAVLAKWPLGWNLEAEILMPDGALRRVNEPVRSVRGTSLSLRDSGGLRGVEAGQLTAASMADLVLARKSTPQDVRAAGLFCAFEGDLAAARKHLGGLPSMFEGHARSLPPADDPAEADARRRLLEAEAAWADPASRAGAIDAFAALLKDRAGTLLVRRCAAGLRARAESPIEYVFGPGDLATAGYFAVQRHPKGELAWTQTIDVAGKDRAGHYVEAAYSVRPGTELRAWALVGGCCAETFAFGLTGTDLPPASPEQPATEITPPIPFLKRSHALHGGPKQPSRFEWVALPSLKHAEGGPKRLRIQSDQEGFSVAALLVSAGRTKPPTESELRELLAGRPVPEPGGPAPAGSILHELWENASGTDMASLAPLLAKPPGKTSELKAFSSPQNRGDNYGTRIRGYVHPPQSGAYVFYLCSDDDAELWLSTDESPDRKKKIAWVTSAMDFNAWDDATPRASAAITLQKGRRYYVEGLQKEGGGDDHLRVGWKLPDGALERPIPGRRLSPWNPARARSAPEVVVDGGPFAEGASIALTVDVADVAAARVEIFQGGTRLGEARGTPPAYTWAQVPAGAYALWARLQDRSGRVVHTHVTPLRVGELHLARAVNLNGPELTLDGAPWADGASATVTGQGFERLDVDLRPESRRVRAQMIRASVASREGTQAAVAVPPGKYLVYLTLWEPEGPPSAVDLLVNGKVVAAAHRFAAPGDWARLGPWPAEAVDGRITVSAARGTAHFSGIEIWGLGPAPKPAQRVNTPLAGADSGTPFEDVWAEGTLLMTGIRVSQVDEKLSSVRPIWGTTARGEYHGTSGKAGLDLNAKAGYAVGALELRAGPYVNAIRVIFFRVQGERLNPADRYESEWYPGPPGSAPTTVVGGDGSPSIGLVGRAGMWVDALGLIQLK